MILILVAIGWLYVALMMAVAEATHSAGTVLGAVITFVFYGVGPVALVLYILDTPARKRRLRARQEAQEQAIAPDYAAADSNAPDAGRHAPADPVAAVRKEP